MSSKWANSMRQRHNPNKNSNSERKRAPLRKIVQFLSPGNTGDIFSSGDKVLLQCGHTVYTHSNDRARCLKCKK